MEKASVTTYTTTTVDVLDYVGPAYPGTPRESKAHFANVRKQQKGTQTNHVHNGIVISHYI